MQYISGFCCFAIIGKGVNWELCNCQSFIFLFGIHFIKYWQDFCIYKPEDLQIFLKINILLVIHNIQYWKQNTEFSVVHVLLLTYFAAHVIRTFSLWVFHNSHIIYMYLQYNSVV